MVYYHIIFVFFIGAALTSADLYPESTYGVELPSGHVQFHRVYASGYQNYECMVNASGSWQWVLNHPVAVLRRYDALDVDPETDPIVGYHEHNFTKNFTVDTGIWTLGTNCDATSCAVVTDKLFGTPIKKKPIQPYIALPLALFQTLADEQHTGPIFQDVTYIQRLGTCGGVVPSAIKCNATYQGSIYNADYLAHYIFARKAHRHHAVAAYISYTWLFIYRLFTL